MGKSSIGADENLCLFIRYLLACGLMKQGQTCLKETDADALPPIPPSVKLVADVTSGSD